jgi:hypothetical protein
MDTTRGSFYILSLTTLERLHVQFFPKSVDINRTASFGELAIVGRNTPQYHYANGTEEMNLKLDILGEQNNRKDVLEKVAWLKALAYADGSAKPPQKIKVIFGDVFQNEVWVVKGVTTNLTLFNKEYRNMPQQAYVELRLALDPDINLTWRDIWRK